MALFDNINSRYTKSMEHGGSYERDAAIGGYDRKELRGLSKQAKRGTLTQRERARYKYLKDERRGRRKRGLLAGLGGVGATLAGLAASGGGKDLMEMIRARLAKEPSDNIEDPEQEVFEEDLSELPTTPRGDYKSRPGASVNRGERMIDQIFNRYR
mgnify:CR=1 FL=1